MTSGDQPPGFGPLDPPTDDGATPQSPHPDTAQTPSHGPEFQAPPLVDQTQWRGLDPQWQGRPPQQQWHGPPPGSPAWQGWQPGLPPPGQWQPTPPNPRGSRLPLVLGILVLVLALAGGGIWYFGLRAPKDPASTPPSATPTASPEPAPTTTTPAPPATVPAVEYRVLDGLDGEPAALWTHELAQDQTAEFGDDVVVVLPSRDLDGFVEVYSMPGGELLWRTTPLAGAFDDRGRRPESITAQPFPRLGVILLRAWFGYEVTEQLAVVDLATGTRVRRLQLPSGTELGATDAGTPVLTRWTETDADVTVLNSLDPSDVRWTRSAQLPMGEGKSLMHEADGLLFLGWEAVFPATRHGYTDVFDLVTGERPAWVRPGAHHELLGDKVLITEFPEVGPSYRSTMVDRSGKVLWSAQDDSHLFLVVGDGIYQTSYTDARITYHRFDVTTGTPLWEAPLLAGEFPFLTVFEGQLLLIDRGERLAISVIDPGSGAVWSANSYDIAFPDVFPAVGQLVLAEAPGETPTATGSRLVGVRPGVAGLTWEVPVPPSAFFQVGGRLYMWGTGSDSYRIGLHG